MRLRLPEIYGKVVYVERLAGLDNYVATDELPEIPQHVHEKDKRLDNR